MAKPGSFERPWVAAIIAAGVLGVFAVIGATLVGVSHVATADRIAQNHREMLLRQMNAVLPPSEYDNTLLQDYIDIQAPQFLGADRTRVYRARRQGQPVALILSPVVARGYSGDINLLVGIRKDGRLAGVRVLSHKETPGLGDKIDVQKSPWILGFAGQSLENPREEQWKVRRDGGVFDQFTGATITPRNVVAAVKGALVYYRSHGADLFEAKPTQEKGNNG